MSRADLILGDCIEVMRELEADSIDAIVTDPPYGLEFMGKEWDAFRLDDPGTMRHRGEHIGSQGALVAENTTLGAAGRVAYGGGKRPSTSRCSGCGKRDQFRNAHDCTASARWITEPIDPYAAPPTSLAFGEWCRRWALEAYRVAKPGAHLLAFGGTRTHHRLTSGLEDAGWEIRDCLVWGYASGFPKSLDVSKAIDKSAGATREVTGQRGHSPSPGAMFAPGEYEGLATLDRTAPATAEAAEWAGWGTALKPAWEPIVMARKPLRGTVAASVLEFGTGALNIDATRIPFASEEDREVVATMGGFGLGDWEPTEGVALEGSVDGTLRENKPDVTANELGRWPANIVITDPIFDAGVEGVVGGGDQSGVTMGTGWHAGPETGRAPVDTAGTYSRFFLIPKAARSDREPPIRGTMAKKAPPSWSSGEQSPGTFQSQPTPARENVHPTVKPTDLMRHLIRLVTPPGGVVLDPFLGSGTTAVAAEQEGFSWVGIERDPESHATAAARLNGVQRGLWGGAAEGEQVG